MAHSGGHPDPLPDRAQRRRESACRGAVDRAPRRHRADAADACLCLPPVRITSYNVCYTKLLRLTDQPCLSCVDASDHGGDGILDRSRETLRPN